MVHIAETGPDQNY